MLILPVTILILILVTDSWIEPFFYLMNIGTPVLINLGTNIFMGEISFVTLAAAPVLQIAVSLDYAIFLSHSFTEYKKQGFEPEAVHRSPGPDRERPHKRTQILIPQQISDILCPPVYWMALSYRKPSKIGRAQCALFKFSLAIFNCSCYDTSRQNV